jgi:hypothetical protein
MRGLWRAAPEHSYLAQAWGVAAEALAETLSDERFLDLTSQMA